jgi:hypothetical protein
MNGHTWWGERRPDDRRPLKLGLGPATVYLSRSPQEWRVGVLPYDGEADDAPWLDDVVVDDIPRDVAVTRYAFGEAPASAMISPALADRSVVSHPVSPFVVPGEERLHLYVSSPLWFVVTVGGHCLVDAPLARPSDTWFGPDTRSGELCYATRTRLRLLLDAPPHRPHRAVTPVLIVNEARESLALERISLPVPHLGLYAGDDGRLWTSPLTLTRKPEGAAVDLVIGGPPPEATAGSAPLAPPRKAVARNMFNKALNAILG